MAVDTSKMHSVQSLQGEFMAAGLETGMTVLVHSSMKKIGGWINGGAESVLLAMLASIGETGTLLMPTHTTNNTDPQHWQNPPVPEAWWTAIRAERPPYHPQMTATRAMGILPENFRSYPDVIRSLHPIGSFAARGKHAEFLTSDHPLEPMFGDGSPIGKLYELDGHILLLGVDYENCTTLHLAEYRADFKGKAWQTEGCAMLVDGERQWVDFKMLDLETDDFNPIGSDFEADFPDAVRSGTVGNATTRLIRARPLVDYAVTWMESNRDFSK